MSDTVQPAKDQVPSIEERVARALCDADLMRCGGSDGARLDPAMPNWQHYRRAAQIAIRAVCQALVEEAIEAAPK